MPAATPIFEIQAAIDAIKNAAAIREEKNFESRADAIDFLEFEVVGRIEHLVYERGESAELNALKTQAEKIKAGLEAVDISLFARLRAAIRDGEYACRAFKTLVDEYVKISPGHEAGYDNLDVFINGLVGPRAIPEQSAELEAEMVFYQKTPARVIFEMVEQIAFKKTDVFFDLGSGLGQVPVLVNLLTAATTVGIEFEPSFCNYARDCTGVLNLANVTFINADARAADYSAGTIFFMYTPFTGEIMRQVLTLLRTESRQRKITVVTYGPCTEIVAAENWLRTETVAHHIYKPAIFTGI